ncbi:ABC transporter G family member 36 [Phytophthora fragariae]|uniref:ABC transporter G family member 36 n=4 Tax=Phytophthora fragariae TaxID=53985 RepID=A0A6A3W0C9_9STRA|nr:ABC transporter G family member 36 [Phytophthora fragariae]KAE9176821.1 ABC transporter G family member 36 [Phytophthora fragariae]
MGIAHDDTSDVPMRSSIEYDNGKTLMARGAQALHDHVASRMEKALGKSLPQMEVRFKDVSITADIMVKDESNAKTELPTLINVLKSSYQEMRSSKHVVKKQILKNVSGVFKPGTITLVLGQPGSGKSSLMKLLSGRFPSDKNVTIEGEVTYNGTPATDMQSHLPQFVSYVTQRDRHYSLLTVKETLEFAHACCGGGLSQRDEQHFTNGTPEENKAALDAARAMFKHYPDIVIQQLGLDNCQNTIVGDAMTRGVSGGERKRVTTGEMEFGNKFVMMMDEISTGLDSAATFDIITTQRSIAKKFRKTVVISLLQPSPEVFELFDDVVILNEGHVMYHGPRAEALGYFESLGFKCPPRRDVADFLLDLGTDKQAQYEVGGRGVTIPRTSSDFANALERSSIYQQVLADLNDPVHPGLIHDKETHMDTQPEFHQNFWDSTSLLVKRQMRVTLRDSAALMGRLFMNTIMGLLYASVFYQFDPTNSQLVMGVIFASVLCLSLGHSAEIPTTMAAREVFYKQRGANFFRTSSYVLSNSASQLPPIILESVVFGSVVYWMCGFVDTVGAFLLFLAMLCITNLAYTAFFFFLASASPNFNVANPISSVSILFFILFGGFAITKDQIPDYLVWLYWINPVAWCVRALAVNQYSDSSFDTCVYGDVNFCESFNQTVGDYSLTMFEVPTEKFWLWYGIVFMAAAYIFFMFLSYIALEYYRYESPENVTLDSENKGDVSDDYDLMRTPRGSPTEIEAVVTIVPDSEKHFIPVTVAFKDLWYTVPDPTNPKDTIDLLKGISGYALPGTITALMGSSGAGKTTLMDVIAGRKTGGTIRGQILLNGHPATDLAIRRSTGYCEQMDIHSESATIREALTFSAFLRQGADVPDSYKYDSVNECLDLLNLHPIADQIIRGSSVEQMKRLTIGPSVLFLDEPTSGLDARSAKLIMDGVRKVANTGRTVVCTIHQPSSEVFSVFNSLLLLKRGGETVFAGELGKNASEMIAYFESIDGVANLEDNYNPATWMLEVIGAGVGNSNGDKTDFVKTFQESKHFQFLQSNLDREGVSRPSPSLPALEFSDKRAATELTQMKFLLQRFFNMYWRTASFNLTRFFVTLVLGLLFGITYISAEYSSYAGINSGMGMLYLAVGFLGIVSFNSALPIASQERAVFYRERAAQTYNAFWYFFGSSVTEIPYTFGAVLLFMAIFYPMVGFTGFGSFLTVWLVVSLHVLLQAYIGEFLVFQLPNVEVAQILGMLLALIWLLFMGFSPPAGDLPTGYKWLYHITPQKYTLAAMSTVVFGDCPSGGDGSDVGCKHMTNVPPSLPVDLTVKGYLEDVFLMKHSEIWQNCAIVLAFVVFFRVLTLLAMRFVNHQKR